MNISINNTTFNGSREVTYGLMMAAKEARNVEICKALMQGPRPLNRATEGRTSEALTKAYMNMATFDDSFYSTFGANSVFYGLSPEKAAFLGGALGNAFQNKFALVFNDDS